MLVYRIASTEFIRDLSGYGAALYGGRWNRTGTAVLYTGSSISLCAWEYWVHLPPSVTLKQNAFSVATIAVPHDSIRVCPDLPGGWQRLTESLHALTDNWLSASQQLVMRVPSAVIPGEHNFLINPAHASFSAIELVNIAPFRFDERAFGKELTGNDPTSP